MDRPAPPVSGLPSAIQHLPPSHQKILPFFVYGTLQVGFQNHTNVVRGRYSTAAPAFIVGAEVFHYGGFPGLYETADNSSAIVYGELLELDTASTEEGLRTYYELLCELDVLEEYFGPGHPKNVYERVAREVVVRVPRERAANTSGDGGGAAAMPIDNAPANGTTVETRVLAWVYVSRIDRSSIPATRVPHGDWKRFMKEQGLTDVGDDWAATLAQREAVADASNSAAQPSMPVVAAAGVESTAER